MNRYVLLIIPFLFQVCHADTMLLSDGRSKYPLSGDWSYIVDPQNVGATTVMGDPVRRGFFLDESTNHADRLVEYDFEKAPTMSVPGSWTEQIPELLHYEGLVWLRKTFDAHLPTEGKRAFVHFGAVNYRSTVYLNGAKVGEHEGGFTPFFFEITEHIKRGKNSLVVSVDNRMDAQSIPGERFDWWNYGGITRQVHLVETPDHFIRNFRLQLDPQDPSQAVGWVDVVGGEAGERVKVSLGKDLSQEFPIGLDGRASIALPAPSRRWSPGDPHRYKVTVQYKNDVLEELIGFRTVTTENSQILVNGVPIFLKGISAHELKVDRDGRVATEEEARDLLEEVQSLNANYVRLTHYPHNRHMAKVADEMGILIWAEMPIYWTIDFASDAVLEKAKERLASLIGRDGNRASVIIWSIANETPLSESRNAFLLELAETVRALDRGRLVSAAAMSTTESLEAWAKLVGDYLSEGSAALTADRLSFSVGDPIETALDVTAYNEYLGWYDSVLLSRILEIDEKSLRPVILEIIPRLSIRSKSGNPLIISELGAGALRGRHGGDNKLWSEEYQAQVYQAQVQLIANSPEIAGMSPWVLKDFRSPRRPMSGIQDYYNRKGLLNELGEPKMAHGVLKDFYGSFEHEPKERGETDMP